MGQTDSRKRRQGRPVAQSGGVGREALLDAAVRLLQDQPPSRVTMSSIAREAGVDPALVRYYFGSRTALLIEIVDRLHANHAPDAGDTTPPIEMFAKRVEETFRIAASARYMNRLMLEELFEADGEEGRNKLRDLNREAIDSLQTMKGRDGGRELVDFDPMFLSLTLVAVSDFFHSATPLLRQLQPDADPVELADRYRDFVTALLTDGLRKR